MAVLPRMLPGCVVADMVAILGSMFFVVGDIDK
jgi:NADH-quinone oxidoreductase subunit D